MSSGGPGAALHWVLRNDVSELARIGVDVDRFLTAVAASERASYALRLTLEELVTNVVRHAWPGGGAHALEVELLRRGSQLELRVADDGVPFDPTVAPTSLSPRQLRDWPDGGRGLLLLQHAVDSLEYRREGGRNLVLARIAL